MPVHKSVMQKIPPTSPTRGFFLLCWQKSVITHHTHRLSSRAEEINCILGNFLRAQLWTWFAGASLSISWRGASESATTQEELKGGALPARECPRIRSKIRTASASTPGLIMLTRHGGGIVRNSRRPSENAFAASAACKHVYCTLL